MTTTTPAGRAAALATAVILFLSVLKPAYAADGGGDACLHPNHDPETMRCTDCGELRWHDFTGGGVCSCGKSVTFFTDDLPEYMLGEADEQGTLNRYHYERVDGEGWKDMLVYTPYGYNRSAKYDVIVLVHGGDGDMYSWLADKNIYGGGKSATGKDILDNAIERHIIKPVIAVTINSCNRQERELRESVLPFVAQFFATYAGYDPNAVSANRKHFAMAGLSNGSLYTYDTGFANCLDLFGNFGCFSGAGKYKNVIETCNRTGLPVYCYYASCGDRDGLMNGSRRAYEAICDGVDLITDGENAYFSEIRGEHQWSVWWMSMINMLQVAF